MSFKLYDAKVRLQGSVLNEVPKEGLTAPEIEILRALHGNDAVVSIKEAGVTKRSDKEERDRLLRTYVSPDINGGDQAAKKMRMFRDMFGHDRNPLPKDLAVEAAPEEDEIEEPTEVVVPLAGKRTKVEKAPAAAALE